MCTVKHNRGVRQSQRLGYGTHNRRHDLLWGEAAFQPLTESGEYGVGIVVVAVKEAVPATLYPLW